MPEIETDSYQGTERRGNQGWHIEKTISVGNVFATVGFAITVVWYAAGQDQRIAANELNIAHTAKASIERDRILEQAQRDSETRNARTIDRIDAKLEKIFEYVRDSNKRN